MRTLVSHTSTGQNVRAAPSTQEKARAAHAAKRILQQNHDAPSTQQLRTDHMTGRGRVGDATMTIPKITPAIPHSTVAEPMFGSSKASGTLGFASTTVAT